MQVNSITHDNSRKEPFYSRLGPLALPFMVFTIGFVILIAFRTVLTAIYYDRIADTPRFFLIFLIGLRMDVILLSYISIVPTALALILSKDLVIKARKFFAGWITAVLLIVLYMEIATYPFIEEYDVRPDRKFLEYLQHPKEVFGTLWAAYKVELIVAFFIICAAAVLFWKIANRVIYSFKPYSWQRRAVLFPIVIALMVLGARSTLGHRPANLSTAAFSNNHLANELTLSSAYTMVYAGYRLMKHEKNQKGLYGKMEPEEVFARVKNNLTIPEGDYIQGDIPNLHIQRSPFKGERPMNIVIFLQESVGAVDTGCLKGPPITPNLCRLKDEGLWFNNLYATGTRTVRGIEATVSGFLPTVNQGVVKLELAENGFFTAANLLQRHGYETSFIYGGMSNFDEMRGFFLGNGFKNIYDEPTFKNPTFHGTWGVSDEDLVRKANEVYVGLGSKPFFSLILSTTNHTPYEFPDGRIELYEEPKQTHFNAVKFADYAIGLFMELAKKEEYYKNTLFLIVADHNSHVRGNDLVPIDKYHIPGLILGPNVPKQEFNLLASQIDLLPTLLHFSGLDTVHPMVGRNLMDLPAGTKGRAIMQYENNAAYRIEDDVVILQPYMEPEYFKYLNERLVEAPPQPEMGRDALAHAYLPWLLYSEKKYRLP